MTTKKESWWERLARIIGGWGLAAYTLTMFRPRIVDNKMTFLLTFLLLAILGLCLSMAHSTVFAITMQTFKGAAPWIKRLFSRGSDSGGDGETVARISGTSKGPAHP